MVVGSMMLWGQVFAQRANGLGVEADVFQPCPLALQQPYDQCP
jgi:hypothetical protein